MLTKETIEAWAKDCGPGSDGYEICQLALQSLSRPAAGVGAQTLDILKAEAEKEDHGPLQFACREAYEALKSAPACGLDPDILWFATQMQAALEANKHRGDWKSHMNVGDQWALSSIHTNWKELRDAHPKKLPRIPHAIDVANFAMMLAVWERKDSLPHPPAQEGV